MEVFCKGLGFVVWHPTVKPSEARMSEWRRSLAGEIFRTTRVKDLTS